jgi:hypothetical protein
VSVAEAATTSRERWVELARSKPVAPYTLDDRLTFFCPRENLVGLELPAVRAFHTWQLEQYRPRGGEPAVLLLLPCQRTKPYSMSSEHRAANRALIDAGYRPDARGDWPEALAAHAPNELLSNAPLRGRGLRIDRGVISEPLGVVPYEAIYRWRGRPSLAARYDDPGLFEHRGIACTWREDCEAARGPSGKSKWGDAERADFVAVHNRLVSLIATVLERWREAYDAIIAYVAPGLTHRSFLAGPEERRAAGLPASRLSGGHRLVLDSVERRLPGAVRLVPDASGLRQLRRAHRGRLPSNVLSARASLRLLLEELERVGA